MLKADQGMDVDGTKVRSGTKMNGSTDDHAVTVGDQHNISDVQATIQAMQKADDEEEFPAREDEEEDNEDGENDNTISILEDKLD